MKEYNVCEQCKRCIKRDISRKQGNRVNCLCYGCDKYPDHCHTSDIADYTFDLLQPERLSGLDHNEVKLEMICDSPSKTTKGLELPEMSNRQ